MQFCNKIKTKTNPPTSRRVESRHIQRHLISYFQSRKEEKRRLTHKNVAEIERYFVTLEQELIQYRTREKAIAEKRRRMHRGDEQNTSEECATS